jgi:hypothetical protein
MFTFVFENYDQYGGQHGVAVVTARSENSAKGLMLVKSAAPFRDSDWEVQASFPAVSDAKEEIHFSIYL